MRWEDRNTIPVISKTTVKLKVRNILQNNCPVLLKNINMLKPKDYKSISESRSLKTCDNWMQYTTWDFIFYKGHHWEMNEI